MNAVERSEREFRSHARPVYLKLLDACVPSMKLTEYYCATRALVGPRWKQGGTAYYGRVQNSWPVVFRPEDLPEKDHRLKLLESVFNAGTEQTLCDLGGPERENMYTAEEQLGVECQEPHSMHWVEHPFRWGAKQRRYCNTTLTRFWGTVKRIACLESSEDWTSGLMWSNLYKLAPKVWNPDSRLANEQRPFCLELMLAEFRQYLPRNVVMMSDLSFLTLSRSNCRSAASGNLWTTKSRLAREMSSAI
jgi:hypothetical protein